MATLIEELDLAWRRAKADAGERGFVSHPHLVDWIEHDRAAWLQHLARKLEAGYTPQSSFACFAPKPGWMLRPGTVLAPEDEVVYNFLVGRMLPMVWEALKWSQGDPDVSYQLRPQSPAIVRWVRRGTGVWREWREKSLRMLSGHVSHVVVADIAGFYENIDINRLLSDLRALGAQQGDLDLLAKCLRRWAGQRGKGIPQGYTSSDILAKVYIDPVDKALHNDGISHLRYVDDLRIFCGSKRDARRAIRRLTELVSNRGLNLQSAKTEIKSKPEAEAEFKGAAQVLEDLTEELKEEFDVSATSPYESTTAVFNALRRRDSPAPEVLERTFREHFSAASDQQFDKSLFHYLLGRLGAAGSRIAVQYCLEAIQQRPEETDSILKYFTDVQLTGEERDAIVAYMESPDAIYDYQLYQLVRWFLEGGIASDRVLRLTRQWAYDQNREPWLRTYCLNYLGRHGEPVDLERIEGHYGSLGTDMERATCVSALERYELGRRNAFYARIEGDGILVRHAIGVVKRNSGAPAG